MLNTFNSKKKGKCLFLDLLYLISDIVKVRLAKAIGRFAPTGN